MIIQLVMARYIVHLQNQCSSSKNANELLLKARSLDHDAIIRDARISSRYIEFDISIDGEGFKSLLEKLSSIAPIARFTEVKERSVEKDRDIEHARSLFNEERYWECHEVLEGVWKMSAGSEKQLLQGMILTCAGFVHSQKDEDEVCLSVLSRALEKLKAMRVTYYGIDIERFGQRVGSILATGKIEYFKI